MPYLPPQQLHEYHLFELVVNYVQCIIPVCAGAFVCVCVCVQYQKPHEVLEMEKQLQEEFKKMKASKDGDIDCNPS